MKSTESKVAEQLSMFGLKATARMRNQSAGQVIIDVLEITEPPKYLMNEEK